MPSRFQIRGKREKFRKQGLSLQTGEEFEKGCLKTTVKGRDSSVMVWFWSHLPGPGNLVRFVNVNVLKDHFTCEQSAQKWDFLSK